MEPADIETLRDVMRAGQDLSSHTCHELLDEIEYRGRLLATVQAACAPHTGYDLTAREVLDIIGWPVEAASTPDTTATRTDANHVTGEG